MGRVFGQDNILTLEAEYLPSRRGIHDRLGYGVGPPIIEVPLPAPRALDHLWVVPACADRYSHDYMIKYSMAAAYLLTWPEEGLSPRL